MKNKIISTAVLAFLFFSVNAQSFHVGIKAGSTINKITGKSFSDQFTYGYHVGAFVQIGLGNKLSIQPEFLFNQVNVDTTSQFKQIYSGVLKNNISAIKLTNFSIPILLNYKLSKFFALQVGPQFDIMKNQSTSILQTGKDAFKKGNLSMLSGVQLSFGSIKIYGRYAIGLSNINDIDNRDKWKSQGFQIGVGLKLF